MASPSNPEASEIRRRGRQRLIGAAVLVALLVVFVPMLLDSEPRPKPSTPEFAIPPKDNAPALPVPPSNAKAADAAPAKAADVTPAKAAEVTSAKAGAQSPAVASVEPRQVAPDAKLAKPTPDPGKIPKPAPDPAKTAAPKLEGFAVQVGAFRDEAKLTQARQKLATAGVVHYTERLESPAGPLTRLRAGPFSTREQAEGALASLKRASLDGKVVALP
jgi:DedD protein